MACSKISSYIWDWKSGKKHVESLNGMNIPFNYFTCGTYFFDGAFRVVKFEEGVYLFHGSSNLSKSGDEFPIGMASYKPYDATDKNAVPVADNVRVEVMKSTDDVSYLMTRALVNRKRHQRDRLGLQQRPGSNDDLPYTQSWFADPSVAKLYSAKGGGDHYIAAYSTRVPTTFFILDDSYNLWKLLNDETVPESTRADIKRMFSLAPNGTVDVSTYGWDTIHIMHKKRRSEYRHDKAFAQWFADLARREGYAGYAANVQIDSDSKLPIFHLEFMIVDAPRYLKRRVDNPLDWFYIKRDRSVDIVERFLEQIKLYKTSNVDFHAGDLYEHSVWSVLYAEKLMRLLGPELNKQEGYKRFVATAAFLHDIGKMCPEKSEASRPDGFVYYSIPTHPKIGGDYIRGERDLPVVDPKTMKITGIFDVKALLDALGVSDGAVEWLARIVDLHWLLGTYVSEGKTGPSDRDAYIDQLSFREADGSRLNPYIYYYAVITVSRADVMASQSFGGRMKQSQYLPFLSNVPKRYRGGNVAVKSEIVRQNFCRDVFEELKRRHRVAEALANAVDDSSSDEDEEIKHYLKMDVDEIKL